MDNNRSRQINTADYDNGSSGPVVYWMSRDQRAQDNWALLYAQREAIKRKVPLVVLFCFVPNFLEGTLRQYGFMLRGLPQIEIALHKKNIPFFFISGEPKEVFPAFLHRIRASGLFVDFSPLRTKKRWLSDVAQSVSLPIIEVDAHNIIPCWSLFQESAPSVEAFRVRLRSAIPTHLNAFPTVRKHPIAFSGKVPGIDWDALMNTLSVDTSVGEVTWAVSGEDEGHRVFRNLLKQKIREHRSGVENLETRGDFRWRLKPYLHFGQLSIQRIVWAVMHSEIDPMFKATFLESLITKRELADHFCYHNDRYDAFEGFPAWAQATLDAHRKDTREYIYSLEALENAETHDTLWNDLQSELRASGRIFGYARRYWAKKILEWTKTPEEALRLSIFLTEKYGLSGWDTSSYLTLAKSIGGVYDIPSDTDHPIFGRVPCMQKRRNETLRDLRMYQGKN